MSEIEIVCRGSITLGTGCGTCVRCREELASMSSRDPRKLVVNLRNELSNIRERFRKLQDAAQKQGVEDGNTIVRLTREISSLRAALTEAVTEAVSIMQPAADALNEYEAWCEVVTLPIDKAHAARAFVEKYGAQCSACGGDCASANPPVMNCPKKDQ
jgi:uncharacterized membrane protein YccC